MIANRAIACFALLLSLAVGCTTEQYSGFDGTVTRNGSVAQFKVGSPPEIAEQIGHRSRYFKEGIWAFDLPDSGAIVLLYDQKIAEAEELRVSDRSLRSAWYVPPGKLDHVNWLAFLQSNEPDAARDAGPMGDAARREYAGEVRLDSPGVVRDYVPIRLSGEVKIESWQDNTHFRVRLDASCDGTPGAKFDGVLTMYDQLEWHPIRFIGLVFYSLWA